MTIVLNEEEIQHFIIVLGNCLDNDPDIREPAENEALNLPFLKIPILADIISRNIDVSIKKMALNLIAKLLTPISYISLMKIRELYFSEPEISGKIKNILSSAIIQQDATISNLSALIYALLLQIEGENMIDLLNAMVITLKSKQFSPSISLSFIKVFIEITILSNFKSDLQTPALLEIYRQVFLFCQNEILMSQFEGVFPQIRLAAATFIYNIISFCDMFLNSQESVINLLQALPNSLMVNDINLFSKLHDIMGLLIQQYYSYIEFFISIIFDYLSNSFILAKTANSYEILYVVLTLWKNFCKFEYDITNHLNKKLYHLQSQGICSKSFQSLAPSIIELLIQADFEIYDEDNAEYTKLDLLIDTLTGFFRVDPPLVFGYFQNIIHEKIKSDDYMDIYIIALLLISITDNLVKAKDIFVFISKCWDYFSQYINTNTKLPLKLKFSILSFLNKTLINYPTIIATQNNPILKKRVENLLQIVSQEDQNIYIINLYSILICNFCQIWKGFPNDSLLNFYFNTLKDVLMSIFTIGKEQSSFSLIKNTSLAISKLIDNFNTDFDFGLLQQWYYEIINELANSPSLMTEYGIKTLIQGELCSIISSFAQKIKNSEIASMAFSILLQASQLRNDVFDDAALAIVHIIKNNPEVLTEDSISSISNICIEALMSQSPSTINSSAILIINIFSSFPILLRSIANPIFRTLSDFFAANKEMRQVHRRILQTMAAILENEGYDIMKNFDEMIFTLMDTVIKTPISLESDSDINYANELSEGILSLYKSYIEIFSPDLSEGSFPIEAYTEEKKKIMLFDRISSFLLKINHQSLDNQVLFSFANTLHLLIRKSSKRNNITLMRRSITNVLEIGKRSSSSVQQLCMKVDSLLNSK